MVGDGFQVLDISEPSTPRLLGKLNLSFDRSSVNNLTVADGYAYLSYGTNGLCRFDLRDPANPKLAGTIKNGGTAYDIQIDGNTGYLANGEVGWQVLDVSDPSTLTVVQNTDASGVINELVFTNNLVFAAAMSSGLQILDVSNAVAPKLLARHRTPGEARSIAMSGDMAYLACGTGGLELVDIEDPSAPRHISTHVFPGESVELVLTVNTNLIVATDVFVYVFKTAPDGSLLGNGGPYVTVGPYFVTGVWGDALLIDSWEFGVWNRKVTIVDLAALTPKVLAQVPPSEFGTPLRDIVRTALDPELRDPLQLRNLVRFGKANNNINGRMHLAGDLLITFKPDEMSPAVHDISTPEQPALIANNFELAGGRLFRQITVVSDRIYAASGGAGIRVLEFDGGPPQIIKGPAVSAFTFGGLLNEVLEITAGGARPLSYQWFAGEKGDTNKPVEGSLADARTMRIGAFVLFDEIQASSDLSARAWIRVSNKFGSTDSESVKFSVRPILSITNSKAHGALTWTAFGAGSWFAETSTNLVDWRAASPKIGPNTNDNMFDVEVRFSSDQPNASFRIKYVPASSPKEL